MALSGSVTVDATPNSCDLLVFSWEATQDPKTNTSKIDWTMKLVASEEYGLIYGVYVEKDWVVTIDGQETTGTADINIDYGETKTLASGTTTLTHEADGTKTFDFSFGLNLDITGWGAKTTEHECPECDGIGLDLNGDSCPICDGNGVITSTSEGVYIGWVRGSGVGELDVIVAPKFPIRDWITGLAMAIVSRGQFPQREPVAFLYGHVATEGETPTHYVGGVGYVGVVAPKVPVVEGLQYAFLDEEGLGYYGLYLTPKLPLVKQLPTGYGDNTGDFLCNVLGGQYWRYVPDVRAWVFDRNIETDEKPIWPLGQGLWSSHAVYNEDGTPYLAASNPIPVYE